MIRIDDAALRKEIQRWTRENTFPNVIMFVNQNTFDWVVEDNVMNEEAFNRRGIINGEFTTIKELLLRNAGSPGMAHFSKSNFTVDGNNQLYRNFFLENCHNATIKNCILVNNSSFINDCTNITVENCQFIDCGIDHYLRIRFTGNNITVKNCTFHRQNMDYYSYEQVAVQLKGESVTNVIVEDCEFINMNDGVQTSDVEDFIYDNSGLIVRNNIFRTEQAWLGGTENAVDLKNGAVGEGARIQIYGNIIDGFLPSDTSAGDGIVIHRQAHNIDIYDNVITNCLHELSVKPRLYNGQYIDRGVYYNGYHVNMAGRVATRQCDNGSCTA